ncbi:MAG: hypothetical protein M3Z24_12610 [Chloroflexota bacterium]|nr:hypothetical protein [Chloroflexota bacterium]
MCISCGCGESNNNHGDQRNITQNDLNNAAQAAGIPSNQAAQNIMTAQGGTSSGTTAMSGTTVANVNRAAPTGDAGHIGPESPKIVADEVKTTEAAFSSGTKPADIGQTDSSGQTGTTSTGQANS